MSSSTFDATFDDGLDDYAGLEVTEDFEIDRGDPFAPSPYETSAAAVPVPNEVVPHDIRRRFDPRRIPIKVAGSICAVIATLCVGIFLYTLVIGPAVGHRIIGSTEDVESLSDTRANIQLPVYVPSLDSRGSRIPVHVSGSLADGSEFNKDLYLSYDGGGIKLEPGSYELHIQGSPISSGGVLYDVPDTTVSITVGEDKSASYDPSTSLIFSEIGALAVTDDQIEEAKKFIAADPERTQYADELAERAVARREDAKREAEEAAAAQEAAAKEAQEKNQQLQEELRQQQEQEQYDTTYYDYQETTAGDQSQGGTGYYTDDSTNDQYYDPGYDPSTDPTIPPITDGGGSGMAGGPVDSGSVATDSSAVTTP